MVVGLDLHQNADGLAMKAVGGRVWIGEEQASFGPFHDRGVVAVCGQDAGRAAVGGVADHLEQRLALLLAVDDEVGVEDLVPAVLAVGLREHHQLHVGRVAAERAEIVDQVIDLVGRQGQAHGRIGRFDGGTTAAQHVHGGQRPRLGVVEQARGVRLAVEHRFRHAVVQGGTQPGFVRDVAIDGVPDATLDTRDLGEPAVVGDVRRLGGPRRDGSDARHDQKAPAGQGASLGARAVAQQLVEDMRLAVRQCPVHVHEMDELGAEFADGGIRGLDLPEPLGQPGGGESGSAAKYEHCHRETGMKSCASNARLQPGNPSRDSISVSGHSHRRGATC